MDNKVSLLIPVYKRFNSLPAIIDAWLPQVNELLVWDNSIGEWDPDLSLFANDKITIVAGNKNYGGQIKFMAPILLKNELVLIADDDIVPEEGFVDELLFYWNSIPHPVNEKIISIFGKDYQIRQNKETEMQELDQTFYTARKKFKNGPSTKVTHIGQVDFVGRLYFGVRRNFVTDMSGCDRLLDDLWWIRQLSRFNTDCKMYVVPATKWHNSDEEGDPYALHNQKGFNQIRNQFVRDNFICRGLWRFPKDESKTVEWKQSGNTVDCLGF